MSIDDLKLHPRINEGFKKGNNIDIIGFRSVSLSDL